jgi:hypothetical protein
LYVYEKKSKRNSKKVIETAKKRFQLAVEADQQVRDVALEDLKFRAGEQWPEQIKSERTNDNRPCLVINRIPQFIRQITNDQRQNRPSIKVHPVDDKADVETAKIYQGLIKHIEYNSGADVAYDTAFEGAATKGFGFFRVITDYVDPTSFEQEILIKQINDDFSVYLDPNHKEPDGSDADWGFVFENIPKEDYKAMYGDSDLSKMNDWSSIGENIQDWVDKSTVRIAEYFYKKYEVKEISLLSNNKSVLTEKIKEIYPEGLPEGLDVIETRKANIPVIKWCKINGLEVLEETTWPGRWIPIIPVYGDKLIVEGRKILEGIVRHAKDSQRMYNYWASTETETIALAPKSPYIVAEGQIPKEYENQWKTANQKSHAYLPYKPTTHAGQLAPPPQRQVYEPPVQGITNARMQASEDLKSTTGIYDAALGARSNETSGIAIQRRNVQAQTSNFHLIDNLTRSIKHCGRIVADLIPKIYDTERAARIIGEEGEQEIVRINQEFVRKGELVSYNLGVGKYDVVVETGPSFATKREEASQTMIELSRVAPNLMAVAPDLIVKNFDFAGAQEIAERLKKTLPPGIADDKGQKPIPPEIQAQLQQSAQMIEGLTAQLKQANEEIRTKAMEIQSKEKIEFSKQETDLLKEILKQSAAGAKYQVDTQLRELNEMQNKNNTSGFGPQQATPTQNFNPTDGNSSGQPMGEF